MNAEEEVAMPTHACSLQVRSLFPPKVSSTCAHAASLKMRIYTDFLHNSQRLLPGDMRISSTGSAEGMGII